MIIKNVNKEKHIQQELIAIENCLFPHSLTYLSFFASLLFVVDVVVGNVQTFQINNFTHYQD